MSQTTAEEQTSEGKEKREKKKKQPLYHSWERERGLNNSHADAPTLAAILFFVETCLCYSPPSGGFSFS